MSLFSRTDRCPERGASGSPHRWALGLAHLWQPARRFCDRGLAQLDFGSLAPLAASSDMLRPQPHAAGLRFLAPPPIISRMSERGSSPSRECA
eukprot:4825088-Alexandrium_andersonii.AAC.1